MLRDRVDCFLIGFVAFCLLLLGTQASGLEDCDNKCRLAWEWATKGVGCAQFWYGDCSICDTWSCMKARTPGADPGTCKTDGQFDQKMRPLTLDQCLPICPWDPINNTFAEGMEVEDPGTAYKLIGHKNQICNPPKGGGGN
jgi:hypothetical protein